MTKIHDSKGTVSEQQLMNLERELGMEIPVEYRKFLRDYNGGYPQPDGFDFADGSDGSSIDRFLGISDSKNEDIIEYFNNYKSRIPDGYFPIAKDPGGNLILVKEDSPGSEVYFWDHENEAEDGASPGMNNMHLISLFFNDFINNLYEIEI